MKNAIENVIRTAAPFLGHDTRRQIIKLLGNHLQDIIVISIPEFFKLIITWNLRSLRIGMERAISRNEIFASTHCTAISHMAKSIGKSTIIPAPKNLASKHCGNKQGRFYLKLNAVVLLAINVWQKSCHETAQRLKIMTVISSFSFSINFTSCSIFHSWLFGSYAKKTCYWK